MDMVREIDLPLPYLTPDIPGTGGVIKQYDEDFVVEEIPRYAACGKGTHVYFTIEKRGLTTMAVIRSIAKALDRRQQDIGYAAVPCFGARWFSFRNLQRAVQLCIGLENHRFLARAGTAAYPYFSRPIHADFDGQCIGSIDSIGDGCRVPLQRGCDF